MDLDQKNSLGQDEKNYEHIIKSKQIAQPNYKYILETENIFDCSIPPKQTSFAMRKRNIEQR